MSSDIFKMGDKVTHKGMRGVYLSAISKAKADRYELHWVALYDERNGWEIHAVKIGELLHP